MAAALPFLAVAAAGVSAVGQLQQGAEAKHAAYAQSEVDFENARLTTLEGEQTAWQSRLDERRSTGEMIAGMAGAGFEMGSGTAVDLIAENAYQRELEILGVRTKAVREANNYIQQGNDRRKAGRAAQRQAIFGAVATALQGASSFRASQISGGNASAIRGAEAAGSYGYGAGAGMVPRMSVKGGW